MTTNSTKRQLLTRLEHHLGPWDESDDPDDILLDIFQFDPEAATQLNRDDIAEYQRTQAAMRRLS